MTEVFYVAVKGSLHAGDSSVFGIKSEEYSALCRRFPDSNKQVINGVLIKGSPLEVINSLAELGYRVTCSSGETEIVWTLRREALVSQLVSPISTPLTTPQLQADRRVPQVPAPQVTPPLQPNQNLVYPVIGSQATQPIQPVDSRQVYPTANPQPPPPVQVIGRPFVVQPPMTRAPTKQVERIGTKPEDWQEVPEVPDRIAAKHISSLEKIDPNQKIILKTNLSSEFNPLSKRPGPTCNDDSSSDRGGSFSMPHVYYQNPRTSCSNRSHSESPGPRGESQSSAGPRSLNQSCSCLQQCQCKRDSRGSQQLSEKPWNCGPVCSSKLEKQCNERESMTVYLEDLISPENLNLDSRPRLRIPSEIYTCLFMYKPRVSESDNADVNKYDSKDDSIMFHEQIYEVGSVTVMERKSTRGEAEAEVHFSSDVNISSNPRFSTKSFNMSKRPTNASSYHKPSNATCVSSETQKHQYSCRLFGDPGNWPGEKGSLKYSIPMSLGGSCRAKGGSYRGDSGCRKKNSVCKRPSGRVSVVSSASHGRYSRSPCRSPVRSQRGSERCWGGPFKSCSPRSPSLSPVSSMSPIRWSDEDIIEDIGEDNQIEQITIRASIDSKTSVHSISSPSPVKYQSPPSEEETMSRHSYTSEAGSPASNEVWFVDVSYGGDGMSDAKYEIVKKIRKSTISPKSMKDVQKHGTDSISEEHGESSLRSFQNSRSCRSKAAQSLKPSRSSTPCSSLSAPNLLS